MATRVIITATRRYADRTQRRDPSPLLELNFGIHHAIAGEAISTLGAKTALRIGNLKVQINYGSAFDSRLSSPTSAHDP